MSSVIKFNGAEEEELRTYVHSNIQVLRHHLYEYEKGIRNLVLHTTSIHLKNEIISLLEKRNVDYLIRQTSGSKINVFFGDERCIEIIRRIGNKCLSDYTDEEDFILGIMLGYDRLQQCDRYITRKNKSNQIKILL